MRVSQYKIVNELCASILEAYKIIERTKNYALLSDCIDALTIIAESIEEENTPKMDDTIGGMVELLPDNAANGNNMPRLILLAEKLQNLAKKELKYRIRVLFVAELSSKWDSLESVYEAFMKRDDIDVDVVLEPIFRATKMPDGTVKSEIIYDDWLTPMGIENIPYTAYNMEQIQPDITFISQPYESVTVPMFWPENIAKYSRLVYAPYFMATSMKHGSGFESLIKMPVEKYSWKILCQSERMLDYYKEYASRHGDNVIVTGLPKWEHVKKIRDENIAYPDGWKEKLNNKTVLLYNSHFLEKFVPLDEMSDSNIFKFCLNRNDVALIWRPHPMTETVKKLYEEDSYNNYLALKEFVNNSSNMILDENVSYDISFKLSDALIDSQSSLLSQFALMEKPIFLFSYSDDYSTKESFDISGEGLYDYHFYPISYTRDERIQLLDNFIRGKVSKIDFASLKNKYYNNNDSKIGELVCETVISSLLIEMVK